MSKNRPLTVAIRASLALALIGACQGTSPTPPAGGPDSGAAAPTAPAATPQDRVHVGGAQVVGTSVPATAVAFRRDGAAFAGDFRTHKVRVADGVVEFTPVSHDPTAGEIVGGVASIETMAISRGDEVFAAGATATTSSAANVVTTDRGGAAETITNREDGIEQAWTFPAAPAGDGEIVFELGVSGAQMVAETATGLHFKTPGGLGFRYSQATWRDAAGQEWDVQVAWDADHIRIVVPQFIVDASHFPATLDPTISAEILTDTPAIGQIGANTSVPDVASDGTNYMLVWSDTRDNAKSPQIWAGRLSSAGALLDSRDIKVDVTANAHANARIAWAGSSYVTVYENHVATGNSDIVAARITSAGVATALGNVASTSANEIKPAIASRGANALAAWQSGTNIYASLYNGTSFGAPFVVATAANAADPSVAADGAGGYLVTYTLGAAIDGQLVTSAGALSGTAIVIDNSSGSKGQSSASFDGTNYVVVYNSVGHTNGKRLSAAGAILDATAKVINSTAPSEILPRVSCTATGCFVVWQDNRNFATTSYDVYGALVKNDLTVTTNDIVVSNAAASQTAPAIGLQGTQWFAAWSDTRDSALVQVYGTRISSAGAVTDATGIVVPSGYSWRSFPGVAHTSTNWGVFFGDTTAGYDVKEILYNGSLQQLTASPVTIASASNGQLDPKADFVGTNMMVAWQDLRGADSDIYAARVSASTGASLDGNGFAIVTAAKDQLEPRIASGGTKALVVWTDNRTGTAFDIHGALVDQAGTLTVADIPICTGTGNKIRPAVAYDTVNNVYLVVWGDPSGHIRGARVSAAGALLDANCGVAITTAAGAQAFPRVAFATNQFLVVWEDTRTNPSSDIYSARVTANGSIVVVDANGIATATGTGIKHRKPVVANIAGQFLVVWQDGTNLATTGMDIWANRVEAQGIAETPYVVSADPGDENDPDVADGPVAANPAVIAYSTTRSDLDAQRVQVRSVTYQSGGGGGTLGQACSSNTQCASGFCTDSVCCNSACGGNTTIKCQFCSAARGATSNGTCTTAAAGRVCRALADLTCDLKEYCDGVTTTCGADLGRNQGLACTKAAGGTGACPSNTAAGAPHVCQ